MYAIITFHSIDDSGSVLSYSPAHFEQLLSQLTVREVPILSLDALLKPETTRGVALTFDDGMRSVLTNAAPLLAKFEAPAHVYVTTDLIGRAALWPDTDAVGQFEMLDWKEVEQLQKSGVTIDAHTRSHPDMRELSIQQLQDECGESNLVIEKMTGRKPRYFAYPFGYHNKHARRVASDHYEAAVTTELGFLRRGQDSAALPRIDSYYLQTDFTRRMLGTSAGYGYFRFRSALRNLVGSQCRPGA